MGGAHSREGLELSDSETEAEEEEKDEQEEKPQQEKRHPPSSAERSRGKTLAGTSFDEVDEKLKSLKIKYSNPSPASSQNPGVVKLYLHIGGKSPNARWIISEKLTSSFFKPSRPDASDDENPSSHWFLRIGSKVRASYSSSRSPTNGASISSPMGCGLSSSPCLKATGNSRTTTRTASLRTPMALRRRMRIRLRFSGTTSWHGPGRRRPIRHLGGRGGELREKPRAGNAFPGEPGPIGGVRGGGQWGRDTEPCAWCSREELLGQRFRDSGCQEF